MRKFSKVMMLTAAIIGVVGIGMSIGGVAMGATITGLNLSKYGWKETIQMVKKVGWSDDTDDWEQEWDEINSLDATQKDDDTETYLAGTASELELTLSAGEFFIKEYDGKQIKVEVSGDDKNKVRVGQEGDTLILEGIGRAQDRNITLYYPKNTEFADVSIELAAGTVNLENDFYAKKFEAEVSAGELLGTHTVTSEDVEITVGTGNVELGSMKVQKLEADCGVGNIDLVVNDKESNYNYEISCGAGAIDIGNSSYSGLGAEKDISNPGASGKMELTCGVGNISVTFEN